MVSTSSTSPLSIAAALASAVCLTALLAASAAGANEAPIARPQEVYTDVDQPVSVWLDYQDPDGPLPFEVTFSALPSHGELALEDGDDPEHPRHYRYTPDPGWSGFDAFTWTVADGRGNVSQPVAAQIVVNARPEARDQELVLVEDTVASLALDWSDDGVPGVPPVFTIQAPPAHGSLVETAPGVFQYTPTAGFSGSDDVQWTVSDGAATSDWATFYLYVNQIPRVGETIVVTPLDTPVELWPPLDDDGFPGPITTEIVTLPEHGTLEETAPNLFLYTPKPGASVADTFTWRVDDGMVPSEIAEATVIVNADPEARDQEVATLVDRSLVVGLDWDDDGLPSTEPEFKIAWGPNRGTLVELSPGVYRYQPPPGYAGPDSFTWKVHDGAEWSAEARVGIDVHTPQELAVRPAVINLVEGPETELAVTSFEVSNAGGGAIEWSAEAAEPGVLLEPSGGRIDPDNPMQVQVEIPIAGLPPGSYTTSVTVTGDAGGTVSLPVNLTIVELAGKNIGIEDMIEVRVMVDGHHDPGGEAEFVNGPGEAPVLEVSLLPEVPVALLELTPPTDLGGVRYLQFDLQAPEGSWIAATLDESLGGGENWTADPYMVFTPGTKRYHVPVEDFQYRDAGEPHPIDLSLVQRILIKLSVPVAGEYGYPGDDARRVRLRDLRLTEQSVDITAAVATERVTVRLDAASADGEMPRPWEGITRFQESQDLLTDLGFRATRESVLDVNDWEVNDRLVPDVGDYHFEMIDTTYQRFAPEVEHIPWIPTIPFLLWQHQDPEILIDGLAQVDRPKYAFMPPSDEEVWQQVVADLVRYHVDSGVNVKAFSILNEPNVYNFWQGTDHEAYDLFAATAEAIKDVDPDLAVAGPSHAGLPDPDKLGDFLEYCALYDVPLDYVSFHAYLHSRPGAETFREAAAMVRDLLAAHGDRFADLPLMVNEWGHSLRPDFAERNQRPIVAAAVASAFKGMVDADIDDALFFQLSASDGAVYYASGLYDFDGTSARPVLYAFDLFHRLGSQRIATGVDRPGTGVDSLAAVDPETGVVRLLVWWSLPGHGYETGSTEIELDLDLPEASRYTWERLVIDEEHGNLEPGIGWEPLEPVGAGTLRAEEGPLRFELPLYGVSMVTFTPVE